MLVIFTVESLYVCHGLVDNAARCDPRDLKCFTQPTPHYPRHLVDRNCEENCTIHCRPDQSVICPWRMCFEHGVDSTPTTRSAVAESDVISVVVPGIPTIFGPFWYVSGPSRIPTATGPEDLHLTFRKVYWIAHKVL